MDVSEVKDIWFLGNVLLKLIKNGRSFIMVINLFIMLVCNG